jgi:hypothetical protein
MNSKHANSVPRILKPPLGIPDKLTTSLIDKVFDFSRLMAALPEGRQFPKHPWKKVFDATFLGAAMQHPSLLSELLLGSQPLA